MSHDGIRLQSALSALYARIPLGVKLGLSPMQAACDRLGNPERSFEAVHVAGTNGKGSVSAMVEAIARKSGLRTGLYTSPHLMRFAERIRLDGQPLADEALVPLLEMALTEAPELTFFETATLAAFLAFRAAKVELAIVEVGLGGRLDATNVLPRPRAAAITGIAFDHMDRLGPTLVEIAREKAGIVKPGLDIVVGRVSPEVREAIATRVHAGGGTTSLASDDAESQAFAATAVLGLAGEHQRNNACVAYMLGRRIGATADACREGIANVQWPGRLERVATKAGTVLLDAAHNPDGVSSLVAYVASLALPAESVALVFGVLADKDWTQMQDALARTFVRRLYVSPKGRAAVAPGELALRHAGQVPRDLEGALEDAWAAVGAKGLVVVAGSILLVGEARALLLGLPRDPPVGM